MQIPLKAKYRWKPRSRFGAVGDDNLKRVPRAGGSWTTVVYNPAEHVLLLRNGTKRTWLHGDAAVALTSREK